MTAVHRTPPAGALLLTGAPGVGKTTIARHLHKQAPERFDVLRFGRLVYAEVLSRTGRRITYDIFRTRAAELVTSADIVAATHRAAVLIREQTAANKVTVVDSHAVSKEHYGWRAVPDSPQLLTQFGYTWIAHLYAPPALILERTQRDADGRLAVTVEEVAILHALQMSVSIYYAGTLNRPLHVVDNTGTIDATSQVVRSILT
jgi:adenylate kinase